MKYNVVISPEAESDIYDAYFWWKENKSVEQADLWLNKIFAATDTLDTNPERCAILYKAGIMPYAIRHLLFGVGIKLTHRIIFTLTDSEVMVLRVRHMAQQPIEIT